MNTLLSVTWSVLGSSIGGVRVLAGLHFVRDVVVGFYLLFFGVLLVYLLGFFKNKGREEGRCER